MQLIFRFLLVSFLGVRLLGAEQYIKLPTQDFAGWNILRASPQSLAWEGRLRLPPGAQLSQTFPSNAAILHVGTQVRFSTDASEWPIMAVGPAALTLIRRGEQGRVMLVLNETAVTELPWSVPLDESGQAKVDLILAVDSLSGEVLVGHQEELQSFRFSPIEATTEVFFANGSVGSWTFDLAEMLVFSSDPQEQMSSAKARGESVSERASAKNLAALAKQFQIHGKAALPTPAGATSSVADIGPVDRPKVEVFTPSSVRRGRILAAVAKATAVNTK